MHTSRDIVTLHVPIENDLSQLILIEIRYQLRVFEVKSAHQGEEKYEHIAYELRYGNLSSIEHGSICMEAHYFI